jgi:uncharacterized OB-fold protein
MTGANPSGHNAPCSNRDFDFFYKGLEDGQLLAQQCQACNTLRSLPSPGCENCGSLDWQPVPLAGEGEIYSYVIHYHPPLPGFSAPHPVALVTLDEGIRLLGAMDGTDPAELSIGRRVKAEFVRRGDVAAFRFRHL